MAYPLHFFIDAYPADPALNEDGAYIVVYQSDGDAKCCNDCYREFWF